MTKYKIEDRLYSICKLPKNSFSKNYLKSTTRVVAFNPALNPVALPGNGSCGFLIKDITGLVRKDINLCRYYTTVPGKVNISLVAKLINDYENDCFHILIFKSNKHRLGEGVSLKFSICLKDEKFLKSLSQNLDGCGQMISKNNFF